MTKTFKNRVAEVNAYMRARAVNGKLYRGEGYYYFSANLHWPSEYVYRASDLSIEQWRKIVDVNIILMGRG